MTRARLIGWVAAAVLIAGGVAGGPYLWRGLQYVRHERTAATREPAAILAWQQAYGDPRVRAAQFTRASDNATAARLAALAKPLRIELESTSHTYSDFPESSAIGRYVNTAGGLVDPSVPAYINAHQADIASIVELLTTTEQPIWRSTVSTPLSVPESSASSAGIRALNNVLAADALLEASQGRAGEADRAIRAAWQVMRSARDQPLLVSTLISMAFAAADIGVVRQTAVDAAAWRRRLGEYDFAAGLERSIEMDVVAHILIDDRSLSRRAFLADYLDGMRANLKRLRAVRLTDPPVQSRSFDSPEYDGSVAPGTIVAEIAWPELAGAYRGALCTDLEVELTERVLDVRQAKAKTGRWPETMPEVASAIVRDAGWTYAPSANGTMSISLSRSTPSCQTSSTSFELRR